ncbi:MAG TPA: hypothetical protein VEW28_07465 [Candidatus Kapabacteria bacterium]|nr:hypothetical protein [Candidatus Kapabacteria bacterium]
MKKLIIAALAFVTGAACTTAAFAQTYKTDFATQVTLAGSGTSLAKTITLNAATPTASFAYTLPDVNGAAAGYLLTLNTTSGGLTWTNPSSATSLAGDVTGTAGANTISKLQGKTLTITTPADANVLIYNSGGSGTWTNQAISQDATITNAGVLTIGTNVVSNSKFRQSVATSVVGNSTNATANVADIVAASDGQVLRRASGALGFGTIATTGIAPGGNNTFLTTNNSGTVGWNALLVDGVTLTGDGSNAALAIKSTYAGQTSITTLGTIGTGTWQGAIVAPTYGGTGINTSATATGSLLYTSAAGVWSTLGAGTTGQVLQTNGAAAPSWVNAGSTITLSTTNLGPFVSTQDPMAITATQSFYRISSSAAITIKGLDATGVASGRVIVLANVGANAITLTDNNATIATNGFRIPGGSMILGPDGTTTLVYDATTGLWRVIANY